MDDITACLSWLTNRRRHAIIDYLSPIRRVLLYFLLGRRFFLSCIFALLRSIHGYLYLTGHAETFGYIQICIWTEYMYPSPSSRSFLCFIRVCYGLRKQQSKRDERCHCAISRPRSIFARNENSIFFIHSPFSS